MTPEERLAHLLDEDRWNGPGFVGRPVEPRQPHPMRRVLLAVAAGLVVGAVVTAGIAAIRGAQDSAPVALPRETLTSTPTSTPTTMSSPMPAFPVSVAQSNVIGVPDTLKKLAASASRSKPLAVWASGRATFSVVLWPVGGCVETPTVVERVSDTGIRLVFSGPPPGMLCPDVASPMTYVFSTPKGVSASASTTLDVEMPTNSSIVEVQDNPADPTVRTCVADDLTGRVSGSEGAAGSLYQDVVLTNRTTSPCTLNGFAGVQFIVSSPRASQSLGRPVLAGTDVAEPAHHDPWPGEGGTVTLAAGGGTAAIRLQLAQTADYPAEDCKPVQTIGIRITLPGDTTSITAVWATPVCSLASAHQLGASDILSKRTTTNPGWQDGKP